MGIASPDISPSARSSQWKWWVCVLLLLATMVNYMDRLTLNQTAKRIKDELQLTNEQYGQIEFTFGVGFALGSLLVGWSVDRWNVRRIYPTAVFLWSVAGFLTGFAQSLGGLLLFRFLLGLFEAGNWSCALRTTQRILTPDQRTLGNGLLQSGAAIGAIITPLVVQALVSGPDTWRYPFFVVGAVGTLWVFFWLATVRQEDLALPRPAVGASAASNDGRWPMLQIYRDRRFVVLVILVITINLTWHFFRVWLPLFLQENHGYAEREVNHFTSAYYLATDLGSLSAGFATLLLARGGMAVHTSRVFVFFACTLLTMLSLAAGALPTGPLLLALLLVIGFGALGLFPNYYSFSQELTVRHQGKLTGTLGCCTWLSTAVMHPLVGRWLDQTHDYASAVAVAGLFPLLGLAALLLLWRLPRAGANGAPPLPTSERREDLLEKRPAHG